KIPLRKLDTLKDSLKVNVTLWYFNDGMLTIKYYNSNLKKETTIAAYAYDTDSENGILSIVFNKKALYYKVGVASTGNFVLLKREEKLK
ncbi:MAG: hypothetical protein V4651_04115, partial [Bacteroidota bacterium]